MDAGYQIQYTSSNGAEVLVHPLHTGPELKDNEWIARFLADNGETIKLLPVSSEPGVKNPDAEIDGLIWEFKTNHTGTSNSIHNGIKRASHQADNVLLHITCIMNIPALEDAIQDRVRQCPNLLKLRIIYADTLYDFTRDAIISRAFRGTI